MTPDQLVDSNIWLEVLEDKVQLLSKYNLSLYDYQNHDTVYSSLLPEYDPKGLHILQKKLLKIPYDEPERRIEFVLSKLRDPEIQTGGLKEESNAAGGEEKPEEYSSQIDLLYLLWKALDFEQMFEALNTEDQDTIFQMVDMINQEKNTQAEQEELQSAALQQQASKNDQQPAAKPEKKSFREEQKDEMK